MEDGLTRDRRFERSCAERAQRVDTYVFVVSIVVGECPLFTNDRRLRSLV